MGEMCLCCDVCLRANKKSLDLTTFTPPSSPNHALAAVSGLTRATPNRDGPVSTKSPTELLRTVRRVFGAQPRTHLVVNESEQTNPYTNTLVFVQRSLVFRFPDTIWAQAVERQGGTALIIFSASAYGHGDLGVNRARVDSWIAELEVALNGDVIAKQPRAITTHGTLSLV